MKNKRVPEHNYVLDLCAFTVAWHQQEYFKKGING
jgi:hypothetical protein